MKRCAPFFELIGCMYYPATQSKIVEQLISHLMLDSTFRVGLHMDGVELQMFCVGNDVPGEQEVNPSPPQRFHVMQRVVTERNGGCRHRRVLQSRRDGVDGGIERLSETSRPCVHVIVVEGNLPCSERWCDLYVML